MTPQPPSPADYRQAAERYIAQLPQGDGLWLTPARRAALRRFGELGFPDPRQEEWRYSRIQGLLQNRYATSDFESRFSAEQVRQQFLGEPLAGRLVFVDGRYRPELSDSDQNAIQLGSLNLAMALGDKPALELLGSLSGSGEHAFAALNLATMQDGAVIRIPAGIQLERPIELLHLTTQAATGHSLRPRHLVLLEADSRATLIERHLALDESDHFTNLVGEIRLAEGARLDHQRIEQEGPRAYHLSELYLELGPRADYRQVSASLGSGWSRFRVNSRFTAPGAHCELDGLYLAGDGQLVDTHLDVDHAVPGCSSREHFKGLLTGKGRAVFDGRIRVREQAQQTDAHLTNANLMLSRQAEIDTKPQLEILADDVQCSHGTSIGQLDEQALFYLRSRGLNEQQARRLLCIGFASEIVDRFPSQALRKQLDQAIRRQLERSGDG